MNNNENKNSIGFYFIGLDAKERATFDRVIAFNVTHGLINHESHDIQSSDLVISSDADFPQFEQNIKNQKVLIIADSPACSLGDVQIVRPLLITRVMKALESTIDLVKLEKDKALEAEIKAELSVESTTTNHTINVNEESDTVEENDSKNELVHSGHHALVIDDSAAIRKQLELELRDAGISADFAESGEQALEKIEDAQYDLVFLDIIMPGIDGYETCRAMRSKASYKRTPIIMLSGKTSPLDEVQGVIAGATTYLTKPVKSVMLQETLTRVTKWLNNFANKDENKIPFLHKKSHL